jgi:hypothetical protein
LLLQRSGGANRRLSGRFLDLVAVASGDGRHSPCLHAVRVYAQRFCYQDEYLPALFQQTALSDETDQTALASPPDFRERLLANLEGMLSPIENRVAAAEYLLDPDAAPASQRRGSAAILGARSTPAGRKRGAGARSPRRAASLRLRGTHNGVCLALDIATGRRRGARRSGPPETHTAWWRTNATVLGIPMGERNVLTQYGEPSGNSIVGDTPCCPPNARGRCWRCWRRRP